MELLIKAAAIGLVGALVALMLKKSNPEISLLIAMAVVIVILTAALELVSSVMDVLLMMAELSGISSAILMPVLKCVGLGVVTRISADICKDAGQSSVSSAVEIAGMAAALYISLPLMKTLLQMIGGVL